MLRGCGQSNKISIKKLNCHQGALMKKGLTVLMLLVGSTVVYSMDGFDVCQNEVKETPSVRKSQKFVVPSVAKDPRVIAVASGVVLHVAQHGMSCPLSQEAQWPAVAAAAGYSTYKMLQSDNKLVKTAALVPAAAMLLALLQK